VYVVLRDPADPPTLRDAAEPVRLVPGPLKDELAVIVVPLTVLDPARAPYIVVADKVAAFIVPVKTSRAV
jgi:hypothetical protein